ncbi:MAG: hypothetical protein WC421_01295 [Elusimicrobiales bacterium]
MKKIFLALVLAAAAPARAGNFDFFKDYAGTWWGSGTTNDGGFAINFTITAKKSTSVKFLLKTGGKSFDGTATFSEPAPGKMLINIVRRKVGRDYKTMAISLTEKTPGSGDMDYEILDDGNKIAGRLLAKKTGDGRYTTTAFLPDKLTIAGLPLPLSPSIPGDISLSDRKFSAAFSVLPAVKLLFNAEADAARKTATMNGKLLMYGLSATLKKTK